MAGMVKEAHIVKCMNPKGYLPAASGAELMSAVFMEL